MSLSHSNFLGNWLLLSYRWHVREKNTHIGREDGFFAIHPLTVVGMDLPGIIIVAIITPNCKFLTIIYYKITTFAI